MQRKCCQPKDKEHHSLRTTPARANAWRPVQDTAQTRHDGCNSCGYEKRKSRAHDPEAKNYVDLRIDRTSDAEKQSTEPT